MGSKASVSAALFLSTNLLCFALLTACVSCIGSPAPSIGSVGCPRDALKLGVCAKLVGGLIGIEIGNPVSAPCCSLLAGLLDLEVAACLCTAIKANILGLNLNVPATLTVLLSACGKAVPPGFTCA